MYTRNEYMRGEIGHYTYYGQFYNNYLRKLISRKLGNTLLHFKDVKMVTSQEWRTVLPWVRENVSDEQLLLANEGWDANTPYNIALASAQKFIDENA